MNTDEVALVTGASQGLGRAIAEELAGRGSSLFLVSLPDSGLPEVAVTLRRIYGVPVETMEIDLTDPDGPAAVAKEIRRRGLHVRVLVNNAGTGYNRRFDESTLEENEKTIELNVLALVRLTHLLLDRLQAEGGAHVLNIGSLAAFFPMPYLPVYSPTKRFVVSFSLALREELAPRGVAVSVLCPNGIRTNKGCRDQIARQGLAGRLTCLYPDEVARAAVKAMVRNVDVIVPGPINKVLYWISSFVPRRMIVAVVSRHWGAPDDRPVRAARRARSGPRALRVAL
jgi:uncharacterized protein